MKRMQEIDINPSTGELDIDIMEQNSSFAIVVSNGKAKLTELPDHGEAKIVMHQGKVKRIRFDEGEDF
ncbi:XtrA/YqaO family protein [Salibacterium lacus]|uniref:XtrA/YqaO family protein n=1 Tax=Salibacterium lacus TaxID=1898109 RepID=A0ABW5SWC4_9BACI